jgi:hypothetical protein
MNNHMMPAGILVILTAIIAGCIGPGYLSSHANGQSPGEGTGFLQPAATTPAAGSGGPIASKHPGETDSGIPLLLTATDWQMAGECGWTEQDIPLAASLLLNNCEVRSLLADGWKIRGIGYDMNFLGSRCRMTTHPDATESCDWCLDAGPTLVLQYNGLTTEYLADMNNKTVKHFRTDIPEGATSISTGDSDIIRLRNGTVLYTFRSCSGPGISGGWGFKLKKPTRFQDNIRLL